jgi:hypothetical protein
LARGHGAPTHPCISNAAQLKIYRESADRPPGERMSKISTDRLPPISFDVRVSVNQSRSDEQKGKKRERERPKPPESPELDIPDDEPKHQFDDLA